MEALLSAIELAGKRIQVQLLNLVSKAHLCQGQD